MVRCCEKNPKKTSELRRVNCNCNWNAIAISRSSLPARNAALTLASRLPVSSITMLRTGPRGQPRGLYPPASGMGSGRFVVFPWLMALHCHLRGHYLLPSLILPAECWLRLQLSEILKFCLSSFASWKMSLELTFHLLRDSSAKRIVCYFAEKKNFQEKDCSKPGADRCPLKFCSQSD